MNTTKAEVPQTAACLDGKTASAPRLALVVPAKDEAARLPAALDRIATWCAKSSFPLELIVVDDGSADGTSTVAEAFQRRLPGLRVLRHASPRGKGAALRTGFAAARAPVVAFSDADLSTPIDQLPRLLAAVVEGADVAVGSRRVVGGPKPEGRGLLRDCASAVFAGLARCILPTGIRDTQCGFKAFRAKAAQTIIRLAEVDGFAFDAEWLALARRLKLRIVEVPVVWAHDDRSTVRLVRAAKQMFADLWRVRRRLAAMTKDGSS